MANINSADEMLLEQVRHSPVVAPHRARVSTTPR